MSEINPCMTCGACCAYFRVSFYWAEADDAGGFGALRADRTADPFPALHERHQPAPESLRGLSGDIGDAVHCTIYENRPSPCREFAMSGENGEENDACNRARARYGLPPLRPLYKDIPALTGAESATTERFAVQSPAS